MPRRMIYNTSLQSVGNGDQAQFQCNNEAGLLVSQHGADLITITPVLDTSAYVAGDVLFATTEIANAVRINGGRVKLTSVTLIDIDDQGAALDLYLLGANSAIGTINTAPDIDDTEVLDVQGHVAVAAGDWKDLGTSRVATIENINLILEAASGATSLYVGAVTGGTPTHTASGMRVKFGFEPV